MIFILETNVVQKALTFGMRERFPEEMHLAEM